MRPKHDDNRILNQQAYLHLLSHLPLVNLEEFQVTFTGAEMMNQLVHRVESLSAPMCCSSYAAGDKRDSRL